MRKGTCSAAGAWPARSEGRHLPGCVPAKVLEQLRAKLEANEFANAEQARRWLKKAHGIERPYASVWNWLKKFGGVLRVPRPVSLQEKAGSGAEVQRGTVRKTRSARTGARKPCQGVGDG